MNRQTASLLIKSGAEWITLASQYTIISWLIPYSGLIMYDSAISWSRGSPQGKLSHSMTLPTSSFGQNKRWESLTAWEKTPSFSSFALRRFSDGNPNITVKRSSNPESWCQECFIFFLFSAGLLISIKVPCGLEPHSFVISSINFLPSDRIFYTLWIVLSKRWVRNLLEFAPKEPWENCLETWSPCSDSQTAKRFL